MSECPTPYKNRYPTEREAIRQAIYSSRNAGHGLRHYRCRCGAWHLTKWTRTGEGQS